MPQPRKLTLAVQQFLQTPLTDKQAAELREYARLNTDLQPEWISQNFPPEPAPLTYEHALHLMKADLSDMKIILEQDIIHMEQQLSDKSLHSKVKIYRLTDKLIGSQEMVHLIQNFTRFTDALPGFLVPEPNNPADRRISERSKNKNERLQEEKDYESKMQRWKHERNESREHIQSGPDGQTVLRQTITLYEGDDEKGPENPMISLLKQMDEAFRLVTEVSNESDRGPGGPGRRK